MNVFPIPPRSARLLLAVALTLSPLAARPTLAQSAPPTPATKTTPSVAPLSLDELYPEKSPFGKAARGMVFSHDNRYVAYAWNSFDDKGYDLWLYDTKEKKATRLTTLETFAPFDRDIPAVRERYQKEKIEDERRKTLSVDERKKLEEDDKKKELERKEPQKSYAGIGEFAWAKTRNELLFTYRGDIYRLKLGEKAPTRITRTKDSEGSLKWTKSDDGFYFRRGDGLFRMRFGTAEIVQLNPDLPNNLTLGGYVLSPDETKLVIQTSRRAGAPAKQVSYITYRDRFAKAQTTERDTGEDADPNESYLFCYDLNDDPLANPKNDGKPWEVYKRPQGIAGDIALADEPFSADSSRFVFATFVRDKKDFQIVVADIAAKKTKTVFTDSANGDHSTPSIADPMFAPDGKAIVFLCEKSGFRHAWLLDPALETANPLTRGNFEAYPVKFAPDGKSLIVKSNKLDAARQDWYRVAIETGDMTRLTTLDGRTNDAALSHDTRRFAGMFTAWNRLAELTVGGDGSSQEAITQSHSADAEKLAKRLTPKRFTYTNRAGQPVQGYLMLPPDYKQGEKRPLLVYVYGGPLGTDNQVRDGALDRFGLYAVESLGYIYAVIDPRGTSGYGAVFGRANYEQPGVPQVEDLVDGVKYLSEKYSVDAKKVGVHGWSFGGFQTQMCLYTAPETFTLGIAGAGPTEWQNYNWWYVGGVIGAGKKPEELDKYSLTKLAKNLKSPLMLLHGLEDTNVLAQDTIKVYRELLKAGKGPLVELVVDPTGGHGLGGDINPKQRTAIYASFLERHWGKGK